MTNMLGDFGWCLEQIGDPVVIVRARPQIMVNGRVTGHVVDTLINAIASMQPTTQREIEHLPEGLRNKGLITYFGPVKVNTVNTSTTKVADRIRYNGAEYMVEKVDDWVQAGYYMAICSRMGT